MPISLSGSLNLSGSLTTTGTITATTLVVETITSSISSITGSTNFGSLVTDTHKFTGSLNVTGSLSVITTGTEFQVTSTGVNLGNALTDSHIISGSLRVNPNGLFVSSSGNVGVGNSSPIALLDIYTGSIGTYFRGGSDNIGRQLKISSATTTNAGDTHIIDAQSGTGVLQFAVTSATKMTVLASGNVGIGTTAPSVVFNVSDPSHGIGIAYRGSSALPSIAGLFTDTGGSGGSGYGDLLVKARTDYGGYYGINFYTAASDNTPVLRMRVQSDGVLNLPYGQIKFPATQNASSDANTLDDYEEGTWTPVIGGSTSQSGQTYAGQSGYYTKIGRQVTVTFRVVLSLKGTITGDAVIKGLPFTIDSAISFGNGATFFEGLATSWYSIFFVCNGGSTFASIDGLKAAGTTSTRATTSDIANNTQFNGSFTYFV
jgi:hypothetical protein